MYRFKVTAVFHSRQWRNGNLEPLMTSLTRSGVPILPQVVHTYCHTSRTPAAVVLSVMADVIPLLDRNVETLKSVFQNLTKLGQRVADFLGLKIAVSHMKKSSIARYLALTRLQLLIARCIYLYTLCILSAPIVQSFFNGRVIALQWSLILICMQTTTESKVLMSFIIFSPSATHSTDGHDVVYGSLQTSGKSLGDKIKRCRAERNNRTGISSARKRRLTATTVARLLYVLHPATVTADAAAAVAVSAIYGCRGACFGTFDEHLIGAVWWRSYAKPKRQQNVR
jgi:hypothetical protein